MTTVSLQLLVRALISGSDFSADEIADLFWLASQIKQFGSTVSPTSTEDNSPDLLNEQGITKLDAPVDDWHEMAVEGKGKTLHKKEVTSRESEISKQVAALGEVKELTKGEAKDRSKPRPKGTRKIASRITALQTTGSLELHLPSEKGRYSDGSLRGIPMAVPAAESLPNKLDIVRSLRPLFQRDAPSPSRVLDESKTVERLAERGVWIPAWQATRARSFDLVLIVDTWSSMVIWQDTVTELSRLLLRCGGFGRVIRYRLTTNVVGFDEEPLYSFSLSEYPGQRPIRASDIVSRRRNRLILILSDCTSPAWEQGGGSRIIEQLGSHNMVAIVNMLPEALWESSRLASAVRVDLLSTQRGVCNTKMHAELPWYWLDKNPPIGVPVPVVTLEPEYLNGLAKMLVGQPNNKVPGFYFPRFLSPNEDFAGWKKHSQEERYRNFCATASPISRLLAGYLSAAPLTLPIMRLVQQSMLPRSHQIHLAEVLRSGLVRRLTARGLDVPDDKIRYEFVGNVRDILLDTVLEGEIETVLHLVASYIDANIGRNRNFGALIFAPEAVTDEHLEIDDRILPFAMIAATVLKRLGLRYQAIAEQIEVSVSKYSSARKAILKDYVTNDPDAPKVGDIRAGKITALSDRGLIVSLCSVEYDVVVPKWALFKLDPDQRAGLQENEEISVAIVRISGRGVLVGTIVDPMIERDWRLAQELFEEEVSVWVEVEEYNSGGLVVSFRRLSGFIPNSHLTIYEKRPSKSELQQHKSLELGKKLLVKLIEVDEKNQRLIMSQTAAESEQKELERQAFLQRIEAGDVLTGTVVNIVSYGIFLDLGAAHGLLHVSEVDWGLASDLESVFHVGDQIDVQVLRKDVEKGHITLSRKALLPDPWDSALLTYRSGMYVDGKIKRIVNYGSFVELDTGIIALVHFSEIPGADKRNVKEILSVGESHRFRILSIDAERRRMSLSMRNPSDVQT